MNIENRALGQYLNMNKEECPKNTREEKVRKEYKDRNT